MPVITISSSFGAAGSVVAQRVADRLGWRLLNRAITAEVASHLKVPLELADAHDERIETGWSRLLRNLATYASSLPEGVGVFEGMTDEVRLKNATERVLHAAANTDVVIVGRAAAIVLRDREHALHVRLDGPRDARLTHGATALGISVLEAAAKLEQTDRARAAYIRELYGMDWRDLSLYHLIIDSTSFSVEACTDLVLDAARVRLGLAV